VSGRVGRFILPRLSTLTRRAVGDLFTGPCRRFFPKVSGWHDDESVTVSPALLYTTVRDSLVFACALPLAELVELGQRMARTQPHAAAIAITPGQA
jgi:hypothetical protein